MKRAAMFSLTMALLGLCLGPAGNASAQATSAIDALYVSRTVVTGRGEANRGPGIVACLIDVLAKVSGDPTVASARGIKALSSKASEFVASFKYRDLLAGKPVHDEQGTYDRPHYLTVTFDRDKIDAALRSLHREPWQGERPTVAVALSVVGRKSNFVLDSDFDVDVSADMRSAFAAASEKVGIPVVLPTRSELTAAGLDAATIPEASSTALQALATSSRQQLGLAGTLVWSDAAFGWIARWRMYHNGKVVTWTVRGVNFDEAFRGAVKGVGQVMSNHGHPS
jgi:hypothetical protein